MKKIGLLFFAFTLVVYSCEKPGCTDLTALNFNAEANVDDGTCEYPPEDPRLLVTGNYLIKDSVFLNGFFQATRTYTMEIAIGGGAGISEALNIDNMWGANFIHSGSADEDFFLDIPEQAASPGSGDGINFSGSGIFTAEVLRFQTSSLVSDMGGLVTDTIVVRGEGAR